MYSAREILADDWEVKSEPREWLVRVNPENNVLSGYPANPTYPPKPGQGYVRVREVLEGE